MTSLRANDGPDDDRQEERRPWADTALSPSDRVESLLQAMTLEEKIAQLGSFWEDDRGSDDIIAPMQDVLSTGQSEREVATRLGIGHLTRVLGTSPIDGPHGARRLARAQRGIVERSRFGIPAIAHEECLTGFTTLGATVFPSALAWAATFDPDLIEEMSHAIGSGMASVGVHQGLAPVLDVVQDYRWGRVEETLGEDPYLVSLAGSAYVRGLQRAGIIATLKHFAGYAASRGGRNHAPVSIGRRELEDVILPPFEMAVREAGVGSVMNAYTALDGTPSAADGDLLTGVLRERWGFTGTVVSDYWAIAFLKSKHGIAGSMKEAGLLALRAGLDVELPGTSAYALLGEAVADGLLDEAIVDRSVRRVLHQKRGLGMLDDAWRPEPPVDPEAIDLDSATNRDIARRIADESIVLLANDTEILPLAPGPSRIALVGPVADDVRSFFGCYSYPIHVLPRHPELGLGLDVESLPDALRRALPDTRILISAGCTISDLDRSGFDAALDAAAGSDVVVAVLGDRAGMFGQGTSGEGSDAADLELPGVQGDLLDRLLDTGTPVVIVVVSGRPYALGRYASRAAAIVQAFMPGAEGASAIAGILAGTVEPSGRLPVQIPRDSAALPHTYLAPPLGLDGDRISNVTVAPLYPFGHGLGYTSFRFGDLELDSATMATDGLVTASVIVSNTGDRRGTTVAQLYLSDPVAEVARPVLQLIGFARVRLEPGEAARVRFSVHSDRLSYTGLAYTRIVDPGLVTLSVGSSAGDLPCTATLRVTGDVRVVSRDRILTTPATVETSVLSQKGPTS